MQLWAERPFEIGADGLRAIGAYQGIFLGDVRRICERLSLGPLHQMTIDFEHARVIGCDLKEGYYLVLLLAADGNEGIARQRLGVCRQQLIEEL